MGIFCVISPKTPVNCRGDIVNTCVCPRIGRGKPENRLTGKSTCNISIHVYIMSVSVSPVPVSENRGGVVWENWGVPVSPKLEDFSKITMVQYCVPLPGDSRISSIWIWIMVWTRITGPGWRIQRVRRWWSDIPMDHHTELNLEFS